VASAKVSGAASGASAGAQVGSFVPGIGTAIGAGVGAVVGLLTAKKGTYAVGSGLRATGYVDARGFHGEVFGLAENAGTKYQDRLTNWAPQSTLSAKAKAAFESVFGAGAPGRLDVDFIGPLTETGTDPQFSDALFAAIQAAAPSDGLQSAFGGAGMKSAAPDVDYSPGRSSGIAYSPGRSSGIAYSPGQPSGIELAAPASGLSFVELAMLGLGVLSIAWK